MKPLFARKSLLYTLVAAAGALFLALALPGAGARGMLAEEIQPYLSRYPVVLEWSSPEPGEPPSILPMPPYEPGAPSPPRWVATSQWPVVAYDGRERMWPVFIRGHQTALGSYVGIALGELLGGGIAGVRRSTVLLGFLIVLLTGLFALRTKPRSAPLCAAIVASSFGMISIARTGYGFEVASRLGMMLALCALAPRAPPGPLRAVIAGLAAAVAILCRGTIGLALLPAMVVLLLGKDRRPTKSMSLLLGAFGVVLPVLLVLGFANMVPFRQGSAPLAGFPWAELPNRILSIPWQSVLTLAWLGDAISIWGPLARGELALGPSLALPSLVAALPLAYGLLRWARGEAESGERVFVAAVLTSMVVGALLYDRPTEFQLALPLEPLFALAVGEQIADLFAKGMRAGAITAALCFATRAHSAIVGLTLDSEMVNPMLSGTTQRAAIARMSALRLRGPEIMTTVYNHAGVIEGWTKGAVRPLHAFPVLSKGPSQDDCGLVASWRELLLRYRPRYVLVTRGNNLYESGSMDPPAIERSLRRVTGLASIELSTEGEFPTESGARGWALLKLIYPAFLPSSPEEGELPKDPACKEPARGPIRRMLPSFEGLTVGNAIRDFTIASIEAIDKDEIRVVLQRGGDRATFEIRPDAGEQGPTPPARGGGYGVFYRKDDQGRFSSEALVAAASALAERLEAKKGN